MLLPISGADRAGHRLRVKRAISIDIGNHRHVGCPPFATEGRFVPQAELMGRNNLDYLIEGVFPMFGPP